MQPMNGYQSASSRSSMYTTNRQTNSFNHYRSIGDLRSGNQTRASWYDLAPGSAAPMTTSRPLSSMATLSRSMTNLSQPITYQHRGPPTAGSYQLPNAQQMNGNGRVAASSIYHQQMPVTSSLTMLQQDASGTSSRRRRRPMMSTGSGYADEDSVFSASTLPRSQLLMPPTDARLPKGSNQLRYQHQQLSTTASSTSALNRLSPEPTSIEPELMNIAKTGQGYNVTMSLNAAVKSSDPQWQKIATADQVDYSSYQTAAWNQLGSPSLRSSRIDLTAEDLPMTKTAFGGNNESLIASTTVVHVKDDGAADPPVDMRATTPKPTTVNLQPTRRRLVSSVNSHDGGYKIKSVKSMSDLRDIDDSMSTLSLSRRRPAGGEEKVNFDVKLQLDRPSSVMEVKSPHMRQKVAEKTAMRQRRVFGAERPDYMMTLNDTMTMNYEPPSGGESWTHSEQFETKSKFQDDNRQPRSHREKVGPSMAAPEQQMEPKNKKPQRSRTPEKAPAAKSATAAPKLFREQDISATAAAVVQMRNTGTSPTPHVTAKSKLFSEQATQISDPHNKSTQTNKNRGTQTETDKRQPDENFPKISVTPVSHSRPPPNSRGGKSPIPVGGLNGHRSPQENGQQDALAGFDLTDLDKHFGDMNNNEEFEKFTQNMSLNAAPPVEPDITFNQANRNFRSPANKSNAEDEMWSKSNVRTLQSAPTGPPRRQDTPNSQSGRSANIELTRTTTQQQNREPVPFGYRGKSGSNSRSEYARLLMKDAPSGSIMQREHREVEEEEIGGSKIGLLGTDGKPSQNGQDADAVLNLDSVSEKVDLMMADGIAELKVVVRCENIVPVRYTPDLFKKSTVTVTKVIEVDLMVTSERRQLYDLIVTNQSKSATGRLSYRDTFDLYQTFMEMAKQDEMAGRRAPQQTRIDRQVDEQRLLDLQLSDRRERNFDLIDGKLNAVHSSVDVDVRAQSSRARNH